jgi:TonB family protein
MRMRAPALALTLLLLPTYIFSQDHVTVPHEFNFPGRAQLIVKSDSMDDHQICFVSVDSDLVGVMATGVDAALLETPSDVDYEKPALLRIDDQRPIPLNIHRAAHRFIFLGRGGESRSIEVPAEHRAKFIRALYTRQRLRLRYSVFPGPGQFDEEIKFGDFAAAYDRGVQLCAWPKLQATAVHPTTEQLAALTLQDDLPAAEEVAEIPSWYLAAVLRDLTSNWITERGERWRSSKAVVRFSVAKDGAMKDVKLVSPSGESETDRAAQSAIRSSSPLPALPSNYNGPPVILDVEFDAATRGVKIITCAPPGWSLGCPLDLKGEAAKSRGLRPPNQ